MIFSSKLGRILIEHIDLFYSLDSELFFVSICSVENGSRFKVINEIVKHSNDGKLRSDDKGQSR